MPVLSQTSVWKRGRFVGLAGVIFLIAAVIGLLLWRPAPLNVILITLDTTRADHLGLYGYTQGLTAGLDDLARDAVVFEHAYAPTAVTLPSHATMLTGTYPPEHGLRVNGAGRLADEIPLLPEILQRRGYTTGAFVSAFVLNAKFGLARGFDTYDDDLSKTKVTAHLDQRRRDGPAVVDAALSWLKDRHPRPFFCWVHLYDAHGQYDSRPELFGQRFQGAPYDAGVAVEAQQVCRVLAFLKEHKLQQKTVVVIAGDHGEGLGDHQEHEHGMLAYNSTLRVPLIFSGAGTDRPGQRIDTAVSLADLTPTILDMLRIPAPRQLSGRSLRAALCGQNLAPRACYAESETPYLDNRWCPLRVVIFDRWKYIHTTKPELYDLESDPSEAHNLVTSNPEDWAQMQNRLEMLQEGFVIAQAQNIKLSDHDRANLEALGYVAGSKPARDAELAKNSVLVDVKDMMPHYTKLQTARHLFFDGKHGEATRLAQEVIRATDRFPIAHLFLGDVLTEQHRYDDAIAEYEIMLDTEPDNTTAHTHLGRVLAKQGQLEQAVAEFRRVVQQSPEAAAAHFDLAETLVRLQRFDEAVAEYRAAVVANEGYIVAHFQLGLLLARMQRPQEAIRCFEQAIKYDPNFTMAHSNLATVLVGLGRIDQAIEHVEQAVRIDPRSFEAQFNLATVLMMKKRYRDGLAHFREAQKLRPEDPRPRQRIQQAEATLRQSGSPSP